MNSSYRVPLRPIFEERAFTEVCGETPCGAVSGNYVRGSSAAGAALPNYFISETSFDSTESSSGAINTGGSSYPFRLL
jgi:hypothetical protein